METELGVGHFVYSLRVQLYKHLVDCAHDPPLRLQAPVWDTGLVAITPADKMVRSVRDDVADYVDRFLNDYLAANPRQ